MMDFGLNGLMQGIGQMVSSAISAKSQKEQAESNERIAQQQIDAQKEANAVQQAFEKEEAELAYQRSVQQSNTEFERTSSKGQLKQLMAAGLSLQQARQIIAGNGSTGTYTPAEYTAAPSVNAMQGVDYSNLAAAKAQGIGANAISAIGAAEGSFNAAGALGSALVESYTSPNGGSYGTAVAQPLLSFLSKHLDELDTSQVSTFADLKKWSQGLTDSKNSFASEKFKKLLNHVTDFAPAVISTNSFFNTILTSNLSADAQLRINQQRVKVDQAIQNLNEVQARMAEEEIEYYKSLVGLNDADRALKEQQRLSEVQNTNILVQKVLGAKYESLMAELNYDVASANKEVIIDRDKRMYLAQTQQFLNDYRKNSNEEYVKAWLEAEFSDAKGRYVANLLAACEDNNKLDMMMHNPQLMWITNMYQEINRAGINTGLIGNFLNASAGFGIFLNQAINTVQQSRSDQPIQVPTFDVPQ